MTRVKIHFVFCLLTIALCYSFNIEAQTSYQKPPKDILDVLAAQASPSVSVNPPRDRMLLLQRAQYPSIGELAEPMLRLAGYRINPQTNAPHRTPKIVGMALKTIPDGRETKINLPANARFDVPSWSPDGKQFAVMNITTSGVELWVGDAVTGKLRRLSGVTINAAYGEALQWMPDSKTILCQTIVASRGPIPAAPVVPTGPNIQENYGKVSPSWTFQDLLRTPHDEKLFDYFAASQLAFVDSSNGKATNFGKPNIYTSVDVAPDGNHFLVVSNHRPYSYLLPASSFPKEVEVWNRGGQVIHKLASLPLQDQVPIEGVPTGPRSYAWRPTEPATLVWAEALDGGNTRSKTSPRDRVLMLKAPFNGQPVELFKTEHRFAGVTWGEKGGLVMIRDYDRSRRWGRSFMLNADDPSQQAKLVWDRSTQDRYNDPGNPVMKRLANGQMVIMQHGDHIYLSGQGATKTGDRPFLDRFSLSTMKSEGIFRCDENSYESLVALLADDGTRFMTSYETQSTPPNYFVRTAGSDTKLALTNFPDPTPQLRGIRKQLIRYKRQDGVDLSFTLYLPPGYKEGTPLPTVLWAYPIEFNDADVAGQVSGSTHRFTTISGYSHLFFLLQGYAVLDNATMPVVGSPETMNNTYVEQIVASAQAAIDKAVEMGVTDRNRVGAGGHSYGAFMTANLLAHSDLFKAGIARSGAYNRTLTPFGFQSERRSLWEASEMYLKVSPFMSAHKIKEPILLIHGEADNNAGTHPVQSDRMYQAIKGNGGTVRYVTLPYESHGYAARESVEHALWEMLNWFNKFVKQTQPTASRK
jgi:dipeptidyl aminopeptidase/acylaminoacyl peptidase